MRTIRCLLGLAAAISLLTSVGCGGSSQPNPPAQSDFALSLSAPSVFVPIGVGNGGVQVAIQAINNYNQPVSVSFSSLPNGITASPALPVSINPGSKQNITLTATAGVSPSLQNITVTGNSGSLTHTASFRLSVANPSYAYLATGTPGQQPYDLVGITADANTGSIAAVPGSPLALPNMVLDYAVASENGAAFFYALVPVNSQTVSLSTFSVNAATGALIPLQTITFPPNTSQTQLVVHPSGKFLYVLQNNCLQAYTIDPATGSLTEASCTSGAGGPNVSFIIPPPGNFAYQIPQDPTDPSGWKIYSVRPSDGSLAYVTTNPATVGGSLFTDPQGRAVYVLAPSPGPGSCGSFSAWQLDTTTGGLSNLNSTFSPLCVPNAMAFNAGGSTAYVTSGAGDSNPNNGIYGATLDPTTGAPTLISGSPFSAGAGASFGAVEPSQGKFLLEGVTGSSGGQVVVYSIDPTSGALTLVSGAQVALPSKYFYVNKMVAASPTQ